MSSKKGVVMEKGNGWAIILLPDGEFKKINTNHFLEVGELYKEANLLSIKYVAAAVILLTILLGSIDYYSVKAYAQVSSLAELGVNRWGRVISVKAKDDNGKQLLSQVEVKNDELEVAVEKIYSQALKDNKKIKGTSTKPVMSISSTQENQPKLENNLLKKMDRGLQKAWQTQKSKDERKDTIKNRVQPQKDKSQVILDQKAVVPSVNAKKGINTDALEEQNKDLDNHVDVVESKIDNHNDKIVPVKQPNDHKNNNDLEDDITNEKNKLKQVDKHKAKDEDQ